MGLSALRIARFVVLTAVLAACGNPMMSMDTTPSDATTDQVTNIDAPADTDAPTLDITDVPRPDGSGPCVTDNDCSDMVFCNGVERCMPGASGADSNGCVAASPATPCSAGQTCDEANDRCTMSCPDADGDGHHQASCGGDDCDDTDPNRFPGNPEVCDSTGHDEDCDASTIGPDRDGDGAPSTRCCYRDPAGTLTCGGDCDDTSMDVSPTAPEVCDGIDDDCDGMIDEGVQLTFYRDVDGDSYGDSSMMRGGCSAPTGYVVVGGDCDDTRNTVHPGAFDACDTIDNDCDGMPDEGCICIVGSPPDTCGTPSPGGGFYTTGACHTGTSTCNMGMPGPCIGSVGPTAESCNGVDDDCDGMTDEGVQSTYYRDADGDGYGTMETTSACSPPTGYAVLAGDCDDTQRLVHTGASEVCNGVDDNCDGRIDEGVQGTFYQDADGDGWGLASMTTRACSAPTGYVTTAGDCDDAMNAVHPGASETCNMIDDDCDGMIDPLCMCTAGMMRNCGTTLTIGACHPGTQTCDSFGNWGSCIGAVSPQPESCNGQDDDCNGMTDEGVQSMYYRDQDGDGYGTSMTTTACSLPTGYALVGGDCDDTRPLVHNGASEICNGIDDNCDGRIDEGVQITYYRDGDSDGWGSSTTFVGCVGPAGYVTMTGDCADSNPAVHPGVTDTCNGIDDDCSGTADPGCMCLTGASRQCGTGDGSGGFLMVGPCHPGTQTCAAGAWGACTGNVDPTTETCNMVDDDCDGMVDEGAMSSFWRDCDADGYGDRTSTPVTGCTSPATPPTCGAGTGRWVANNGDCDDTAYTVHQSAPELCNNVDDDCDGTIDGMAATSWCDDPMHAPANEDGVCNAGATACTFTCQPNFADCNATTTDGCESNTSTDPLHCGSCATACRRPICTAGSCAGDIVEVRVGGAHACGRRQNGTVVCWGRNANGQLGDGTTTDRNAPVAVTGITNAIAISVGTIHSCAVLTGGAVMCWGANTNGRLGDGTTTQRTTPVAVATSTGMLTGVTQLSAGGDHNCALTSAGLQCWGAGFGTRASTYRPTTDTYSDVTCGRAHTCVRVSGYGTVYCWGDNSRGQLGDGTTTNRTVSSPAHVTGTGSGGGVSPAMIVSGPDADHTCYRVSSSLYCFGAGTSGQLGNGTTTDSSVPVAVTGGSGLWVNPVALGADFTCGERDSSSTNHRLYCWGNNANGQLGTGTTTSSSSATLVSYTGDPAVLGAGASSACMVVAGDTVVCWGSNANGQVGDGTLTERHAPVAILDP